MCVCMSLYALCVHTCPYRPEGFECPKTGFTDSLEPFTVGAGN